MRISDWSSDVCSSDLTWEMDGVPDMTQLGIKPGESFTYKFIADPAGTMWYHCHVNVNEHVATRGMWGPFIIDPIKPAKIEREITGDYILMFRSEEHTSELQSLMRISYAVFCLKKKNTYTNSINYT